MIASRSHSVRRALHLHTDPAPQTTQITVLSPDSSPSSSSIKPSGSGPSHEAIPICASSKIVICSVLCLHDFKSEEEGALVFRRNEILEVVKQESTGWWAAMRKGGSIVGWIPEAFVTPLSQDMADRLRKMREEMRLYEYEAEQLYNSAPTSKLNMTEPDTEASPAAGYNSTRLVQRPPPPRYVSRSISREVLQAGLPIREGNVKSPSQAAFCSKPIPQPPPSPSGPMPRPPAHSAPLYNKPVPPIPLDQSVMRTRTGSLSNRSLRRRPLLLDDNTTLSRLSALIETKNTREIDKLVRRRNESHDVRNPQVILKKPWYILPAHADELELDKDSNIRAGTLLALVERLTSNAAFFDPNCPHRRDTFASVFLMTFRTFTTSENLFDLLLDRFSMTRPDNLNDMEVEDWKKRCLIPTQRHVLDIFTLWLEEHRLLEEDLHIAQRLPGFLTHVAMPRLPTEAQALIQTIERLTFATPARVPMGLTPRKPRKSKAHRNELLRLDPSDVAEQLTLYEYYLYSKIKPRECLTYAKVQVGEAVVNLVEFCKTYDRLAGWVKSSILNSEVIGKRSGTVDFWIKVAEKCRQLNNFSSMSAIISSLSSTVITRLLLTWAHVNRKSHLDSLLKYNEPTGGFSAYRNLMANVEGGIPCVPFITMYLTDIMRIREQYNDEPGRICFVQKQRWYETTSLLLKFQNRPYQVAFDESITTFIQNHLKDGASEDNAWFWSKSQEVQQAELAHADIRKGLEQAGF